MVLELAIDYARDGLPVRGPEVVPTRAPDDLSDMPALPAAIRCGSYDTDDPEGFWSIDGEKWRAPKVHGSNSTQTVNWDRLRTTDSFGRRILSERVVHSFKLVAAEKAPAITAGDLANRIHAAGLKLLTHLEKNPVFRPNGGKAPFQWEHFSDELIESLEQTAQASGKTRAMNTVNALRQWYVTLAVWPDGTTTPGTSPDLAQWWAGRTTKKGRGTSRAASTDPVHGPLTLREIDMVRERCVNGTRADLIDRIVVWLLIVTMGRDIELRRLCRRHFLVDHLPSLTPGAADAKAYHLVKPQAKSGRKPRARDARRKDDRAKGGRPEDFRFKLPAALGRMIEEVIEPGYVTPARGVAGRYGGHKTPLGPDSPLLYWLQGGSAQLYSTLQRFVRKEGVTTDRVLDSNGNPTPLRLDNYRFRHGVARVHQELGASIRELQQMLGHGSKQTTEEHYSAHRASDGGVLERAAGRAIAPLIQTMLTGRVEDPKAPLDLPLIPGAVPHLQRGRALKVIGNIGKCSKPSCDKNPVVSCFGCPSFVGGPGYLDALRRLRQETVDFLMSPEANEQSPHFVAQLRQTLAGLELWIAFLEKVKTAAAAPDPEPVALTPRRGRPRRPTAPADA